MENPCNMHHVPRFLESTVPRTLQTAFFFFSKVVFLYRRLKHLDKTFSSRGQLLSGGILRHESRDLMVAATPVTM